MVWSAVHETQNHPVAIKVMTAKRARHPRFLDAFREEVRAVARLSHPNIIRIFDSGEVDEAAEDVTDGHLVAGSPYLVMELADSTLVGIDHDSLQWSDVRTILTHILDALAHSHARGLVHRDIKPDNVLFLSRAKQSRLKLSDFGLAHAIDASSPLRSEDEAISGTPRYMAPEQITGQVRDQGPWTDLYALGCLAYRLTGGAPPFSADTVEEVLQSHLQAPLPTLEPKMEVPDGFAGWVERLLARQPTQRFRRAADAAVGLARIDDASADHQMTLRTRRVDGEPLDLTVVNDVESTRILDQTVAIARQNPVADGDFDSAQEVVRPELPRDWRHHEAAVDSIEMVGVGLGLYGLRQVPMVGRHAERDALWQALGDACHTGRPHGVVLRGPAGIGKTRLAEWLAGRAHEVGAVNIMRATHSPIAGPAHGIGRMVANFLECNGLQRHEILERVRNYFASDGALDGRELHQCMALTELLVAPVDPDFDDDDVRIRFGSKEEEFVVYRRFLERAAQNRPLLLVFDDVHWGSDTLQFMRHIFASDRDGDVPVLMVCTVRSETSEDYPLAFELLSDLLERPFVQHHDLERLSDDDHNELIHHLLGLEQDLAQQVAARTAGNPLFAIQLVGDWVQRGVLQIDSQGFRLPEGETAPLPEDIHDVLVGRIEKLVGHKIDEEPSDALRALELAAVLGRKVDNREWKRVCLLEGLTIPSRLLDTLASQSLADPGEQAWTFVHGALRETLERIATEQGRIEGHYRQCATMLQTLHDDKRDERLPRLARYLLAAGDYEAALEPLLRGMKYYRNISDYESALAMFGLYEEALERLDVADDDRRIVRGEIELIPLYTNLERFDEAEAVANRVQTLCDEYGWSLLGAEALHSLAFTYNRRGEPEKGLELALSALPVVRREGDGFDLAQCLYHVAWLQVWCGKFKQARGAISEAVQLYREVGDERGHVKALICLGAVATNLGEYEYATSQFEVALKLLPKLGMTLSLMYCLNNLGEVLRKQGDLTGAQQYYQQALDVMRRTGVGDKVLFSFNLGMTLLEREAFDAAEEHLQRALQESLEAKMTGFIGITSCAMAAVAAGRGDWTGFDEHFQRGRDSVRGGGIVEADIARALEISAGYASAANRPERVRKALELAIEQCDALEYQEQALALRQALKNTVSEPQ